MDKQNFLALLQDTLQCEDALEMEMRLVNIPEWDSMAAMATMALADRRFGKQLKLAQFKKLETVEELYALLV
ncbi:phosphopantetheine-binding protein [Desulfovibrio sp. OttesenSCG-928-F20]|nr:phosphopantetheine-binding protein [Desulfovibrio sp. OttesenSCG-928-M16]MDL2291243.1 phosphopantetheine-binding protein [Desulfovibrio sp. OttesenSCG-928-F20]